MKYLCIMMLRMKTSLIKIAYLFKLYIKYILYIESIYFYKYNI